MAETEWNVQARRAMRYRTNSNALRSQVFSTHPRHTSILIHWKFRASLLLVLLFTLSHSHSPLPCFSCTLYYSLPFDRSVVIHFHSTSSVVWNFFVKSLIAAWNTVMKPTNPERDYRIQLRLFSHAQTRLHMNMCASCRSKKERKTIDRNKLHPSIYS